MRIAGLLLRPVTAEDDRFLRQLNAEERRVAYDGLALPAPLLEQLLDNHLKVQSDHQAAEFPNAETRIIVDGSEPIGRLTLTLEYSQFGGCLRIVDLVLCPEMRRQGKGRAIVSGIVDLARKMRLSRVTLSIFAANTLAIKFFKKTGFRTQGGADEAQNVPLAFPLP